jgi:hypothetical protein
MTRVNMVTSSGVLQVQTSKPDSKTNGFTETFKNTDAGTG